MVCHLEEYGRIKGTLDEWISLAISSALFVGFLPGAIRKRPGKYGGLAGSLAALGSQFAFLSYAHASIMIAAAVLSFVLGFLSVTIAEDFMLRRWGPCARHTGEEVTHDFNQTCIDEVHGQLLAGLPIWLIPYLGTWTRVALLVVSFVLFRFFDAKKVWLVGAAERRFKGSAFGVMFDDTVAGFFAAFIVFAIATFI